MVTATRLPQGVRLVPRYTFEVCEGMTIAQAIAAADVTGGDCTILLYPGVYDEGDLTPTGGASITIRGMGRDRVRITPTAAPTTAVIVSAHNLYLENVIVAPPDATRPALRVTGGVLGATNSSIVGVGAGDAIQQVGGNIELDNCRVPIGDIDLSTGACVLELHNSDIHGPIDTAGALAHTILLDRCNLNNQGVISAATGATTLTAYGCTYMGQLANAGTGNWVCRDCDVGGVNFTSTGTLTLFGGDLGSVTRATASVVWWRDSRNLYVLPSGTTTDTMIQYAIDACGGEETIHIGPGIFVEALICNSVSDNVTLRGYALDRTIIRQVAGTTLTIEDCDVNIENLQLEVTAGSGHYGCFIHANAANASVHFRNAKVEVTGTGATINYGICATRTAGNVNFFAFDTMVEVINTAVGASTSYGIFIDGQGNVILRKCRVTASDTNGTARTLYADQTTVYSYQNVYLAYGATDEVVRLTSNAASRLLSYQDIFGDGIIVKGALGVMYCKKAPQVFEVFAGMEIGDAITGAGGDPTPPAATNPYTILIYPGIYDEQVQMAPWRNLKGVGPKGSVVIYQTDADVLYLQDNVELENLTMRLGTPTGWRNIIYDNGGAFTARLTNIRVEVTTPGAQSFPAFRFNGAGNYIIERCSYDIGGTGAIYGIFSQGGTATIRLIDNDFELTNVNAEHINCSPASIFIGKGNRWAGTCHMFFVSAGTFTFDNCALLATGGWTNTGSTMTLRHCAIEAPVVAGNGTLVRLKNSSYKAIQRAGTGNIVDESPDLKDAPWHVQKWDWMTVLANMDVSIRGTPVDAGSGQIMLEVTDNVAGQEAVELTTAVAGSQAVRFPAATTPRFLTQIGVDSFDAHVTMFFGLREILGNAIPVAGEEHAGFDWNGTNFRAISSDGAVQEATNLTTPTANTHVQLEVIVLGGVQVEFYVNGVLVATHSTRIPGAAWLSWQHLLATAGAGAGDVIQVTVKNGGCARCPV